MQSVTKNVIAALLVVIVLRFTVKGKVRHVVFVYYNLNKVFD